MQLCSFELSASFKKMKRSVSNNLLCHSLTHSTKKLSFIKRPQTGWNHEINQHKINKSLNKLKYILTIGQSRQNSDNDFLCRQGKRQLIKKKLDQK